MEARYLNVDLIIESSLDLSELSSFLKKTTFLLWEKIDKNYSSIGLESKLYNTSGPEEDIREILNVITSLPDHLKKVWEGCNKKVMDIGFECGSMNDPIDSFINSEVLYKLADQGCSINIRIYPCYDENGVLNNE